MEEDTQSEDSDMEKEMGIDRCEKYQSVQR